MPRLSGYGSQRRGGNFRRSQRLLRHFCPYVSHMACHMNLVIKMHSKDSDICFWVDVSVGFLHRSLRTEFLGFFGLMNRFVLVKRTSSSMLASPSTTFLVYILKKSTVLLCDGAVFQEVDIVHRPHTACCRSWSFACAQQNLHCTHRE